MWKILMEVIDQNQRIQELKAEIAALKAQMSKVENVIRGESGYGWQYLAWTCPVCKTRRVQPALVQGLMPIPEKACRVCGVRFDWSEGGDE